MHALSHHRLLLPGGTILCAVLAPVGCSDAEAGRPAVSSIEEITAPSGPGSAEPFLAATEDGAVLSWLEPDAGSDGLYHFRLARLAADGRSWSPPATVISREDFFVNWADFPSVLPTDGGLVAHWLQRSGSGVVDYDVRVARSDDGGETWSEAWTPHEDGTKTEHGFVSMTTDPRGGIGLVWLDGRAFVHGHDGAPPTGEMSLRFRRAGPDGPEAPTELLDDRVCDCCQTAMARTDEGLLVAYRDRSDEEIRDISAVRMVDGRWTEPAPVHRDGWEIAACPVNGPQVDARGRDAVVAWFTAAGETPRVKVAFSADAGATFQDPVAVDGGNPAGRVDVLLLEDGSALVSFLERVESGESGGTAAELRLRRVHPDGTLSDPRALAQASSARASGFPRMTLLPDGDLLVAWTDVAADGTTSVRVARASLSPDEQS